MDILSLGRIGLVLWCSVAAVSGVVVADEFERDLVGHWQLTADCRDSSVVSIQGFPS